MMQIQHLQSATDAELDRMADILTEAFSDDPLLLRCSGNSLNNLRKGMRSRAERTIPRGGVWLAKEGDEVVGLMVCDLPGQDSPEAISVSMSNAPDSEPIPAEVKEWIQTSVRPGVEKLETETFGPHGERDSMYVHFLAVDPSARGKGVGRLLMAEAFRLADEQGVRTTLLNPKEMNLAIYGRMGFIEAGKTEIASPDGKHPLWTMYREPRKSA